MSSRDAVPLSRASTRSGAVHHIGAQHILEALQDGLPLVAKLMLEAQRAPQARVDIKLPLRGEDPRVPPFKVLVQVEQDRELAVLQA